MKHKKENSRNNFTGSAVKKNSLRKTKQNINNSHRVKNAFKKNKLISLQHQTINTLQKLEKLKMDCSNNSADQLSKKNYSTVKEGDINTKNLFEQNKLIYKNANKIMEDSNQTIKKLGVKRQKGYKIKKSKNTKKARNVFVVDTSNSLVESLDSSCNSMDKNKHLSIDSDLEDHEEEVRKCQKEDISEIAFFYKISDTQVLLTLVHPCSLYFIGVLEAEVLTGSVNVLGYTLNRFSGRHRLYSPKGVSHLSISSEMCGELDETVAGELIKLGLTEDKITSMKNKFHNNIIILVLNKDESETSIVWRKFVATYANVSLLANVHPESSDTDFHKALQCKFHLYSDQKRFYNEIPDWKQIVNFAQKPGSRTVLCGGKGVGKSTLLKYLVNQSLTKFKEILVLDFDIGQAEFTVPGCVSASLVTSPLLGPNFSHVQTPLKSLFVGDINAVPCIHYYFQCVEALINFCNSSKKLAKVPWFINTMGFSKGIGVFIMTTIIKKVSPTAVVQINCANLSRDYPQKLLPDYVEANILNFMKSKNDSTVNYKLFEIPSAIKNTKNRKHAVEDWGISAPGLRNIMILSYFGQLLNSEIKDIHSVEPYTINVSSIWIYVMNENLKGDALLDAVNGNLVALCHCSDKTSKSINVCHGFGIVRAVNKETQQLFLITPVSEDKLCKVNSLVKGNISLPERMCTVLPGNMEGHVPYISLTNNILSNPVKKTFKKIEHTHKD